MEELSIKLRKKRGNRGVREVAAEIGISHMTLTRVELGKQPDLQTFAKICKWLGIDPASILGLSKKKSSVSNQLAMPQAHFRADKTMNTNTAKHLADLIIAVQRATEHA